MMGTYWNNTKTANNDNLIHMLMLGQPPVHFKPGRRYQFSNTGYVLLASIIEKVSGLSYGEFMAKYIFEPLQMKSSRAERLKGDLDGKTPNYALGFSYSDSLKNTCLRGILKPLSLLIIFRG